MIKNRLVKVKSIENAEITMTTLITTTVITKIIIIIFYYDLVVL